MNSKIQQAIQKEKEIENLVESAKSELCDKVSNAEPLEGVRKISDNPKFVAVSMSTIAKNGFNLCPSTYIPDSQASAVKECVSSAKTAGSFQKKVNEMLETGKAKSGNNSVTLNTNTMKVLQDYVDE